MPDRDQAEELYSNYGKKVAFFNVLVSLWGEKDIHIAFAADSHYFSSSPERSDLTLS